MNKKEKHKPGKSVNDAPSQPNTEERQCLRQSVTFVVGMKAGMVRMNPRRAFVQEHSAHNLSIDISAVNLVKSKEKGKQKKPVPLRKELIQLRCHARPHSKRKEKEEEEDEEGLTA